MDEPALFAQNIAIDTQMVTAVQSTGVSGLMPQTFSTIVAPPPPPPPKKEPPQRVGGDVLSARLIRQPAPVYPPMARTAKVSGVVVLEVQVDEDGNVTEVKPVSGPALLRQAAMDAVRQWKYSPTLLNGEPIPVVAEVRVNFSLN